MSRFLALIFILLANPVWAAMSLDKIIVYLDDSPHSRDDIVITNPDEETLYLQTEIFRVDNPGMPDEKRVRVVDPKEFKLLVSPAKAVLSQGEKKRFRLMSLERGLTEEKVYRVTFKPVVGEIKSDRPALKVLVAFQALVFVQPESGAYDLSLVREGNIWKLKNLGNVNADVAQIEHCRVGSECADLDVHGRIYAKSSLDLGEVSGGGEIKIQTRGPEGGVLRLSLE
ncbi:hypothetical protein M0G74_14170 [Microbulbifer sp. CAU 1566]|uniref:fimbrial biogenesis chaperone n=1 Tax=Microbulbifer sp. CAU 1566 TaxID=2933269 RepID=UPI002002AAEE|nr:hypothetical protein [Microbulbifer sp. CAU 1566]MCK7598422.1 hypothetical protein [Microbulbifer sp. CAU 1566]